MTDKSPAARAGLKPGDVIVAVDGQAVDDPNAFDYRFATHAARRQGRARRRARRQGEQGRGRARNRAGIAARRDRDRGALAVPGAKVANLSPALADELRLDSSTEGVVVVDIADGSLAQQFGFQRGDILLAVNGAKIAKTRDLEKRRQGRAPRVWRITIQRGGQQISAVFGG